MSVLSNSQFPAQLLPAGATNNNAISAQSQTSLIDMDPMIMNNARYLKLMNDYAATAQAGSHHAEPSGSLRRPQ